MKKKSSIIKLSIIGVALIIGLLLSFVSFRIPGTNTDFTSFAGAVKLGLDLEGGIYAVYEMDETESRDNLSSRMEGTRTRLENMLVEKGYTEATVVLEGETRLRVEVPDVDDPSSIFELIGKPAELKFVLDETGQEVISGKNIEKAQAMYSNENGGYVVSLELDAEGTEKFAEATANNSGKTMSIISTVDGEEIVISSPTINEAITNGEAIITGNFTQETAQNLADQITSGQFDVKLSLLESNTVSPTLGDKALFYGIIAGLVGLALVMIFMCIIYRGMGGVASVALLVYMVFMLFFLAVLPWVQLTLPGIAGILLSLGMAVDGNVIIFERIKEEYRGGKSILASKHAGFKKATIAIIDSNVTTIIAAIVLLIFGTGSIQGFALTLLVGILLSMFTSLLVSNKLLKYVMAINSTNPKFYNLKRDEGVVEIADDDVKNVTVNDGVSFDQIVEEATANVDEQDLATAETETSDDNSETTNEVVEEKADEPNSETANEVVEEKADEPNSETANEVVEEKADEPNSKTANEVVEEKADEPNSETTNEVVEEKVDEPTSVEENNEGGNDNE